MNVIKSIILPLLLYIATQANAKTPVANEKIIPATLYTIKDGLPNNNIHDIVQDQEGFLWLATEEGLSRYDSSSFTNFSKDKSDGFSLPGLLIDDIILMPNGKIWMSIHNVGIAIYDQFHQRTTSIKNTKSNLFKLPNSNLFGMDTDRNNNVWFSLYGEGIYQWNTKEGRFYKHLIGDVNAWLKSKQTFEIMIDSQNRLWVCTIDSHVYMYNIDTGTSQFFDFSSDPNNPLSSPIYGFAESNQGIIYAGGYAGVFAFNEEDLVFDPIIHMDEVSEFYEGKHTSVRRLMFDTKDNLWIGTTRSLLHYSNKQLSRIKFYKSDIDFSNDWTPHSMYEGNDGNIWIGTEGMGLIKLTSDWDKYYIYISEDNGMDEISGAYLFEDLIWIIHFSSKIDLMQIRDGKLQLKSSFKPDLGLESVRIDSLFQDKKDEIWISSIEGIHKINVKSGETTKVINPKGKKLGAVRSFIRGKDGLFYFYLFTENKIGYFNEEDMQAHFLEPSKDFKYKVNMVNLVSNGLDNSIWFATNLGMVSYNYDSQKFSPVYKTENDQMVSSFLIDPTQNTVWMIADGELYELAWNGKKLQRQKDRFKQILPKVIFDKVSRIKDEVLMITTEDNGVVEINVKTLKYKVFTTENGLPANFVKDVLFPDDTPLIITEQGVAIENKAHQSPKNINKARIIIDTVKLGSKKIPKNQPQLLSLEHDYGSLNFEVSFLSFINSADFEYQYKLEGLNEEWNNTGNNHNYRFLNLDSGLYTFKVQGRSNYGEWSDSNSFTFKVNPAPWKTWWAFGIYALLLLASIFWIFYVYKRKIVYEHEITRQQLQKQIAKAASKAKSDFLAKMSHEIRTPLNGVLGMGELMLDTQMDDEQTIYAEAIVSSGRHLLDIINDILDLSKIEAGKINLASEPFDLLLVVDEIVRVFTSQSKQKQLLFTCVFDHSLSRDRIGDEIRIKQILFNLLSNAFKFTHKGQVVLTVSASKTIENEVIFSIIDTGIGIDNKLIEPLFEPFMQADSTITRDFGGTGLGLAIVKQLLDKMKGKIKATGIPNKGSEFNASICLKQNQQKPLQLKNTDNKQVCLQIQQSNLHKSLQEYLKILNIKCDQSLNSNSFCIFMDVISPLSTEQIKQLKRAQNQGVIVYFIGFNLQYVNAKYRINLCYRLLSTPVSYHLVNEICCKELSDQNKQAKDQRLQHQSTHLKLLMIEDNSINQLVSFEMLENNGYTVDIVDTAEEALNRLSYTVYDLILVDYHLPGMDGFSFLENWSNSTNTPVIIVTADLTDEVIHKCQKQNIKNFLAKPFTQAQLMSMLEQALNNTH